MIKLLSIPYKENSEDWHSLEYIPDNPRSILVYTKDGGVAEASYKAKENKWIQFRWGCEVNPTAWREMPRYNAKV